MLSRPARLPIVSLHTCEEVGVAVEEKVQKGREETDSLVAELLGVLLVKVLSMGNQRLHSQRRVPPSPHPPSRQVERGLEREWILRGSISA